MRGRWDQTRFQCSICYDGTQSLRDKERLPVQTALSFQVVWENPEHVTDIKTTLSSGRQLCATQTELLIATLSIHWLMPSDEPLWMLSVRGSARTSPFGSVPFRCGTNVPIRPVSIAQWRDSDNGNGDAPPHVIRMPPLWTQCTCTSGANNQNQHAKDGSILERIW